MCKSPEGSNRVTDDRFISRFVHDMFSLFSQVLFTGSVCDLSEQLGLPGIGADVDIEHRLFFALLPPPADASRIFRLAQRLRGEAGLKGKLVSADRLHVSLHGLGEYLCLPEQLVSAACEAGDAVCVPQFDIAFDCAGSLGGRGGRGKRPFVLWSTDEVDLLTLFHRALAKAMAQAGLSKWIVSHFTPHITLLYDSRIASQRAIETVRFRVHEFALVDSLIRHGRYELIARWPLRG
jgi:RNA 2',3'-cyclic 3'-phosphodiesterase